MRKTVKYKKIDSNVNKYMIKGVSLMDVQLFVNALWAIIFFTLKWRLFAFVWILILALLIIFMIVEFYKKNKLAGILQIPYLLWVLFASYLNVAIYALNK